MLDAYNPTMPVLALFFLSGLASLILETVFRRQLALCVGSAITATTLTLATFLAGLAIGAVLFGRVADRTSRPLRLYGWLELGVGVTGGLAVYGLGRMHGVMLAPALLLPPTILMGGTLPALIRHRLSADTALLGSLATLYGVNTLGAAAGTALAGFYLFEAIGIAESGWLGAGLAAAVGLAAFAMKEKGTVPVETGTVPFSSPQRRTAIVAATLAGAVALGYEVVWTRLLVLPLRSYAYSFSLMLALFLFGLVIGAAILARLTPRISDPLAALAVVLLASSAYVAASLLWLPPMLAPLAEAGGFGGLITSALVRGGPIVLPPTILSGMALPLAMRVYSATAKDAAGSVGAVYAANTLGSIAGALAAGLVLIPALGASRALAVLAMTGATAGAIAAITAWYPARKAWATVAVVGVCALAILLPPHAYADAFSRTGKSSPAPGDTLFYNEGATDTVAVVRRNYGFRDPDAKSVIVNGIAMTATVKPVWRYMAAEGHLPALFAPAPARGLVVCVGTGITLGALASHATVTAIDAVDLSESVLAALPVFDRENRAAYRDPKVHVIHADGRHFLERSDNRYDLITLEPPPPIVAGSVHLYTLDFYRLCKRHLTPGGVVAQWLPLHAQSLASAQATARTFLEAFPHAQLWLPSIRDAVLIGSDRPLALDPARVAAAYATPATKASLEDAYFETPQALLATYLLDRDGIARWSASADLITDDHPLIEFFRRYGRTMGDREIGTLLTLQSGRIDDVLGPAPDPALRAAVDDERRAHFLYLRSEIANDPALAREAAFASRATRFGLYRVGCDTPQLQALAGTDRQQQVSACRELAARASR